ncbi:MAG: signal recognition particle-docking protein FtsY [Hormoscilla sp.]
MVFNWFRRQVKGSEESSESKKVEQPEVEETGEKMTSSPASELAISSSDGNSEAAEDNLNWAKAAYENIQQAKIDSSASATSSEPSSPAAVATPLEGPREIASESKKPKSFLERAKSERLGRLEELKERAIAEPEPEPEPEPGSSEGTDENSGEIAFDEGFLWSAEVLKAQGRRPDEVSVEEITWLKRLRQGLGKSRRGLINQLKGIVGQGPLNQDAVMEIEALLLSADVGVQVCDRIIDRLQVKVREETLPPEAAIAYLKQVMRDILDNPGGKGYDKNFAPQKDTLNIWLMTGVNGVGKTTTIGKIAHLAQKSDYRCLIGAADTFRAAAVEQIKVWGTRSGTEVIANQGKNTDPAAVVFDAISAAIARNTELLLIDTAGRLQNKQNLMEELRKIRRIIDKQAPDARVESLLVLDATLGQNGLRQAEVFCEVASLSGVVLTKLDGTAKGGVALAVAAQLGLPIRFIGAGEGIEDLRPFSSYEFVEALIGG